jgi:hypothetical protein
MQAIARFTPALHLALVLLPGCCARQAQLTVRPESPRPPVPSSARVFPSAGVGSLVGTRRGGGEEYLHLRRLVVEARRAGDQTVNQVEHVFFNSTEDRMEGTFRFPLPPHALLVGLAMEVNGKLVEGEIVEREKAQRVYQSIVDEMRDPALLEWEQGNTFKLRVFPIEARQEKRVVLRYLAPLERRQEKWRYVYATAPLEGQERIDRFRLSLDGQVVVDAAEFLPGLKVDVPVGSSPATGALTALREIVGGASYTALRVAPDWRRLPPASPEVKRPESRRLLVLVDTSRSSLETRPLVLDALRSLLEELEEDDQFLVVATDVGCVSHARGFVAAAPQAMHDALAFLQTVEPDGATDLGNAFRCAGQQRLKEGDQDLQIVYLGDGLPTWGETQETKLAEIAARSFGDAPFFALVLGKEVNLPLLERVAGQLGGRAVHPAAKTQVIEFARFLRRAAVQPGLREFRITLGQPHVVFPRQPTTLFEGDDVEVLIRTPAGESAPEQVSWSARRGGNGLQGGSVSLGQAVPAPHVAQRWAAQQIAFLEAQEGRREEIVKLSTAFGVMSRHTSFLVLESEEAYHKYAIERRKADQGVSWKPTPTSDQPPQVTGTDLESVGWREQRASGSEAPQVQAPPASPARSPGPVEGSLSQDQLGPGDPEVVISAPQAAKVTLVFPTGEVKACTREAQTGNWVASFLIPQDTGEGIYRIRVLITLHSGEEVERYLHYQVDGTAPRVRVELSAARVRPHASVRITIYPESSPDSLSLRPTSHDLGDPSFAARVRADIREARALLPSGQVARLLPEPDGRHGVTFAAPDRAGRYPVRVVVGDHARNRVTHLLWLEVGR